MVAKGTHMTVVTVKKYLASLVGRKLTTDEEWLLPLSNTLVTESFSLCPTKFFC